MTALLPTHPDRRQALVQDPDLVARTMEETLRARGISYRRASWAQHDMSGIAAGRDGLGRWTRTTWRSCSWPWPES
ncbi:hypothetical protein [Streptosporangium sp. CA-115845]|uniref:hypothetical protein n=1 Tax=Streptosporangium sp. CA-115845 TaxID=3240071 RepID=UPI003D91B11F